MLKFSTPAALAAVAVSLLAAACGTPPANLDLSLQHPSFHGKFLVRMDPPATGPAINQMHAWQVRVETPDGKPVPHATIGFDGGMPQHGHGFPTKPRITREVAPGVYALEGMKFSMTGWWDMRLAIEAGGASDEAEFNVIVDDSGIRRVVAQDKDSAS
ncbi:FixH family protein [Paraburkholderia sacchari]|uniref:FixH family protein n=1 Tax=Paraburkholderia sacchari TaxID=159450 RepID=UPI001BD0F12D|nr:FixH family protein [Paraburkholderia sacchari]